MKVGTPWPGIVFRTYSATNLQLKADSTANTSSNITSIKINNSQQQRLCIIRINDKVYYSLNNQAFQAENKPFMDFTNIIRTFDAPVTLGGVIKPDSTRMRAFKGTISDVFVGFISDDATLADYQNALP